MEYSSIVERFLTRLSAGFGERLQTGSEAISQVAGDESGLPGGWAEAVIWPQTTQEVSLIASEASDLGVPLIPRGAGTGKSGGCIPEGGVVVDLSRMNQVQAMCPKDLYAVVQPGLITVQLDDLAKEHGLLYPPDPSSWESSTLGGNIATNAGGPRAVKYGVTHRYVWGLEMVLGDGRVFRTGRKSIKGVAGYDLSSLFVGSEGTLGFITEATLHLVPRPLVVETAWLCFKSPQAASDATSRIFEAGLMPCMVEMMDATALEAVRPVASVAIPEGIGAALLIETDGSGQQPMNDLIRLCEVAVESGAHDVILAQNEKTRQAIRRCRRLVSGRLKEAYPFKISDDIAVPRSRMTELLNRAQEHAEQAGIPFCAYGHMGDGNLHVNLLCSKESRMAAEACRARILSVAVAMEGTISGEHGIGIAKRDHLPMEQGDAFIDFQRQIKGAFDPKGVMNPKKIFV